MLVVKDLTKEKAINAIDIFKQVELKCYREPVNYFELVITDRCDIFHYMDDNIAIHSKDTRLVLELSINDFESITMA